ncbi:high choriolytic enzyme 1-like isoform X1 [Limanda limanda]|uniref:high choriolytic enzyme 1-like isoform X1 n=1 Tax=Limanda limanda TaxID=27771 RepID=UPI0029C64042|nr:high choriolytic enzyme 1-like isoform X1 [Limanda limanda]XP_060924243.1 high choriolytic enzyme 1-like isoform X1 [Limanda limanda]XP_060924245.1 high choriolytic enzyme 1-like isoform X1 [Limanda limanda]XP_060924247.1 high choriolytic enzyme 1-like isoform X1 [Limanda limanda]
MTPSVSLLLLLLLGLSQAHPLQEEGVEEDVPEDTMDITNMILTSNNAIDEIQEEELEEEVPEGSMDITTRILTSNNATDELLLEGDMLAPRTRNAMRCWSQKCLWKKSSNGQVVIPFTMSREFSSMERQKIDRAMKSFQGRTCIRFVPRQNQYDYISIENRGGCFSSLGRVGGRQVLSLNKRGCVYYGIIQHEFNHALGFQHEQTRSDRDSYVRINWANINQRMAYNFYKSNTNNLNTPYDYSSIMHYGKTAFSIQRGRDSITPIPNANVRIGQRQGMSSWDIMRINRLYSC